MKLRGIVVLEGADGTGKTTLARALVAKHDAFYIHNGLWPNMWQRHLAAVDLAIRRSQQQLVVIDRLFLSEQIYGQVFRGGPAYDLGARCLDRALLRYGAVTVLCVRKNLEKHLKHFEQLKASRVEKFNTMREVACRYLDLWLGNLGAAGNEYVNQLTRFQDFSSRRDVLHHDMDRDGVSETISKVEELVDYFKLYSLSGQQGLYPNLTGNVYAPQYLFVGEQLSPRACPRAHPFLWNDDIGAASRINAVLRELQFDETKGVWTNAISGEIPILKVLRENLHPNVIVIALGQIAYDAVCRFDFPNIRAMYHPQWDRRFRAKTPHMYVEEIRRALAP